MNPFAIFDYLASPKVRHNWFRRNLPLPDPKALKPFRRSQEALMKALPEHIKYSERLTPYNAKRAFLGGFIFTHGAITYYNYYITDVESDNNAMNMATSPADRIAADRQKDPNRMPWPVVHKYVTEMREGKRTLDDLGKLWEQTRHYYPHDWLIPLECTQVLKYSTGKLLSQYVEDPEEMRKQLLFQLINVRYDRVKAQDKVTQDVKDIIAIACDDLAALSFEDPDHIPLVPVHSSRGTGASDLMA